MNRRPFARLLAVVALAGAAWLVAAQDLRLPNAAASVKFAVIGDSGTGDRRQAEVADQLLRFHGKFPLLCAEADNNHDEIQIIGHRWTID